MSITYRLDESGREEPVHILAGAMGDRRVVLECAPMRDGQPPEWLIGLYRGAPGTTAHEFGELGALSAADLVALHTLLASAIAEARRRGLFGSCHLPPAEG